MSKHEAYIKEVSDRLLEQIKNNKAPWQKPWEAGDSSNFVPVNSKGTPYKGANFINLMSQAIAKGYDDNRWFTFNSAREAGGRVKKGEKATTIHYWKFREERIKRDENGQKVLDKDGNPIKQLIELDRPKVFYAKVFNAEQIDGLPERKITPSVTTSENNFKRHERCEAIIKSYLKETGVTLHHKPTDRAYYSPSSDSIVVPEVSQFKSPDLYYATVLHEIGHSTGHEERLNRDLSGGFGSQSYAKEELRAEISSMFVGQELEIGHDPSQHIAYLQSWAKVIEEDPKEIFKAVKDSDKITQYVLSFDKQRELKKAVEEDLNFEKPTVEVKQDQRNNSTTKTYLYVPFEEKEQAKALGAKWDKVNKSWYAPQGSDLDKFSRWTEEPKQEARINISAEDEFTQFLQSQGVEVKAGHPKLDGRWHRLHVQGDKAGSLNASYVVFTDNGIPRGVFNNFKTGEKEKWVSSQRTSTRSQTSSFDIEQAKIKADLRQKEIHDKSAKIAQAVFSVSTQANPNHNYLKTKGVTDNNVIRAIPSNEALPDDVKNDVVIAKNWREAKALREDTTNNKIILTQGDLVVPAFNKDGELRTIQTINWNGFKGYLKGGEKHGNHLVIGDIQDNKPFLIAEGYSTGATLHEQTGQAVVVAFDKNNLMNVAKDMREKFPDSRIYFAADNDHEQAAKYIREGRTGAGGELNAGVESAEKAAKEIDGYVLIPEFKENEHGSDWNDIYINKGVDELKRQLREQVLSIKEQDKQSPTLNITKKNFSDPELAKVQDKVINLAIKDTQNLLNDYSNMDNTLVVS